MRFGAAVVAIAVTCVSGSASAQADGPRVTENGSQPRHVNCQLGLEQDLVIGTDNGPDETVFGNIIAYDVAADGTIFIVDGTIPVVRVFGADGRYRRSFGRRGRGPGEFQQPYRIVVQDSLLVVYDRALGRLGRFDTAGSHLSTGLVPFSFGGPPGLALTPSGNLLIAAPPPDPTLLPWAQIHEIDRNYSIARAFGSVDPFTHDPEAVSYLATGQIVVSRDGNMWFSPVYDYEIQRYSPAGLLTLVIKRDHDFEFGATPYVQRRKVGERVMVGFDLERALSTALSEDKRGYLWHFVRDVPRSRAVIDVFSPDGIFLQSHSMPLQTAPGGMDEERRFYRIAADRGYPQLIRYRSALTGEGDLKCPNLRQENLPRH